MNKPVFLIVFIAMLIALVGAWSLRSWRASRPILVGVMHSCTGVMAISEAPLVEAIRMAVAELNEDEEGRVLGRKIEVVVVDGKSNPDSFAVAAQRLIVDEKVSTVFGCWTSACRKRVQGIFEEHNHLLIYPIQYEGLEQSPNIVYTGLVPSQQVIPALRWSFLALANRNARTPPRLFLVGSNYIFPRMANAIIKEQVQQWRGTIVGEAYVPLASDQMDSFMQQIVDKIGQAKPDVILNTINGESNRDFFQALREAGVKIPTMSFSIAENEFSTFDPELLEGDHYTSWTYFQSLNNEDNRDFVRKFKDRYSKGRVAAGAPSQADTLCIPPNSKGLVTDDPLETAYSGVYLWANAVKKAGSANVHKIRKAIAGSSLMTPSGMVHIDDSTQHAWKNVRIGKLQKNGQFEIEWDSKRPIRPLPYPLIDPEDNKEKWDAMVVRFRDQWQGQWASPIDAVVWVLP